MTRRIWTFLLGIVAAIILLCLLPRLPSHRPAPSTPLAAQQSTDASPSTPTTLPTAASAPTTPATAPEISNTLGQTGPTQFPPARIPPELLFTPASLPPDLSPTTLLENMRTAFHSYASMFGGNPVGNNAEITRALLGENPKQAIFLKAEAGQRISSNGELVDAWGTPYFFHQLSGTEMEIRSAGPDKKMYTADDLVIK